MEHIGHGQSGTTFAEVFTLFHKQANALHNDPSNLLTDPILLGTDCAAQLQNGWLVALRKECQITNRIMMHSVSILILLWWEHQQNAQNTLTAYHIFECHIPSGIHSCRAHVCRAINDWVVSKDREPGVKMLGKRFVNMFPMLLIV